MNLKELREEAAKDPTLKYRLAAAMVQPLRIQEYPSEKAKAALLQQERAKLTLLGQEKLDEIRACQEMHKEIAV